MSVTPSEQDQNLRDVLGFDPDEISVESSGGTLSQKAETPLQIAAKALGIDPDELRRLYIKAPLDLGYVLHAHQDPDHLFSATIEEQVKLHDDDSETSFNRIYHRAEIDNSGNIDFKYQKIFIVHNDIMSFAWSINDIGGYPFHQGNMLETNSEHTIMYLENEEEGCLVAEWNHEGRLIYVGKEKAREYYGSALGTFHSDRWKERLDAEKYEAIFNGKRYIMPIKIDINAILDARGIPYFLRHMIDAPVEADDGWRYTTSPLDFLGIKSVSEE